MTIEVVLSSGSIPWVFNGDDKVRTALEKGYDGIELLLTRRALQSLPERLDWGVFSLHEPFGSGGSKLVHKLSFLDLQPFPTWSGGDFRDLALSFEAPIVKHLEKRNFYDLREYLFEKVKNQGNERVALELKMKSFGGKRVDSEWFLDFVKRYRCEICFDIGYMAKMGWDPIESFIDLHRHVSIIHFYDMKSVNPNLLEKNVTPGNGILPLKQFLRVVQTLNWSGQITLELLPEPLSDHREALEFIKRNL